MGEGFGARGLVDMRGSSAHGNALIGHEPSPSRQPLFVPFDHDEARRGLLILTLTGFIWLTTRQRS